MGAQGEPTEVVDAARRLAVALDRRLDASLEGLAITYAQLELLERIVVDPDAHPAELARKLGCSRQAIASLMTRLIQADLVDLSPLDHGVRVPSLTALGERRVGHARRALHRTLARVDAVPVAERQAFVDAATSIRRAVLRSDDPVW